MPTLEDPNLGASLVPDLGKSLELIRGGVKTFQTRQATRAVSEAATPEQEKQALVQLSGINPQVAQAVQGILQRKDRKELEAASLEVRKGLELATRLKRLDFNGQQRLLMDEARLAVAENRDPTPFLDKRNKSKDELRNEIDKMIVAGTATETLLKRPEQEAKLKREQDARDASAILQMTPDKQAIALDTLAFKAEQEGDTDGANALRQIQRLSPEQRQVFLQDVVRQVPQAKPISVAAGATLIDPVTRQPIFQPTKSGGIKVNVSDAKNFTGESLDVAGAAGGTFSDLRLRPEVMANLGGRDAFKIGREVKIRVGNREFFVTPVTQRDKTGKVVTVGNITPIVGPDEGKEVDFISPLGETGAELQRRTVATAGQKTRAERRALIETQKDLTSVEKRTERDFVDIDSAIAAAENVPALQENLKLLKTIETGGIDAIVLATARKLGVESADQAELTFNLRTNVLRQLKPTFGAQFTESEGKLLAEIEANETKSTAGNIRLMRRAIEIYQRAIARGKRAAKRQGDTSAIEDIDAFLEPLAELSEGPATAVPKPGQPKIRKFNPETRRFE